MSKMPNRALLVVIAVVSVIAIAVVAVTSKRADSQFEVNSPQWVVQQYLVAMFDGDTDTAIDFIAPSSPCNVTHLDRAWVERNANIDLVEVDIAGESARVEVDIEFGNSDIFSTPYVESHVYRLEKTTDSWQITGIPWPVYDCGELTK